MHQIQDEEQTNAGEPCPGHRVGVVGAGIEKMLIIFANSSSTEQAIPCWIISESYLPKIREIF